MIGCRHCTPGTRKFFAATPTILSWVLIAWLAIPDIARVETATVREALAAVS
jgi:hypothetical protein